MKEMAVFHVNQALIYKRASKQQQRLRYCCDIDICLPALLPLSFNETYV